MTLLGRLPQAVAFFPFTYCPTHLSPWETLISEAHRRNWLTDPEQSGDLVLAFLMWHSHCLKGSLLCDKIPINTTLIEYLAQKVSAAHLSFESKILLNPNPKFVFFTLVEKEKREMSRQRSSKHKHCWIPVQVDSVSMSANSPLRMARQMERQTSQNKGKHLKKHLGCTADQVSEAFSFIRSVLLLFVY